MRRFLPLPSLLSKLILLAPVLLLLGAPAPARAATATPPDPDATGLSGAERLDALFARVKAAQSKLHSLEANFMQRKESELFVEPEVARGRFLFLAPDRVRWEFTEPNPMVVVIGEDTMTTWYRDLKQAEVLPVGRYSEQVFKYMGASGSLETLLDYFRVSVTFPDDPNAPYRLSLDPRYPRIAKRIQSMDIWIDHKIFVPVRLRYVEPGGDSTDYRFSDLEINPDISPKRFELDLPPDVETRGDRSGEQTSP